MADKDLEKCTSLNYEAEYERARSKCDELYAKLKNTEEKARCLHEENLRCRAVIKTLEFVFGRKFDD